MSAAIKIQEVINDPSTSAWLREALKQSLERDAVDAANDAELLADLLDQRCTEVLSACRPS